MGIANTIDKIVTPIHKSFQANPKFPKRDTKIEDKTIPKPTPIKWEVLSDFFPSDCIEGRIKAVAKIKTNALDMPAKNRITIKIIISLLKLINNVVSKEITIDVKKTNLIFFLNIGKIDSNDPHK